MRGMGRIRDEGMGNGFDQKHVHAHMKFSNKNI